MLPALSFRARAAIVFVLRMLFVSLWLATGSVVPAQAAELFLLDFAARNDPSQLFFNPVCNAQIEGVILPGDTAKIEAKLAEFARHPSVRKPGLSPAAVTGLGPHDISSDEKDRFLAVCLSSQGGDIVEAMKIAKVLWNWIPVVEADTDCFSACAVLFMKINPRDRSFSVNPYAGGRYLHFKGRLGFHAPHLEVPDGLSPTETRRELAQSYARALLTLGRLSFSDYIEGKDGPASKDAFPAATRYAEIGPRLAAQEDFFPIGLLLAVLNTPPDQIYIVETLSEAMNWNIEIFGFVPPRTLTEQMLYTACVNVARIRCNHGGESSQCLQVGRRAIHALDGPPKPEFKARKQQNWPRTGQTSDLQVQTYIVARDGDGGNQKAI